MVFFRDLNDQVPQWRNSRRAALSRAVPLFPRKVRYRGPQPSGANRSHSPLEEMKRNALQQTRLCTASTSRKQPASLPRFTAWRAEHGCLLPGRIQLSCLLGEKCFLGHRSKISKAFRSACLSYVFFHFSSVISRFGYFCFPFFSKAANRQLVWDVPLSQRPWWTNSPFVLLADTVHVDIRQHLAASEDTQSAQFTLSVE